MVATDATNTFINAAAHILCLLLDAIYDTFTSRSTTTPSTFKAITLSQFTDT